MESWPPWSNRNRGALAGAAHLAGLRALFWDLGSQEVQCVKCGAGLQARIGLKLCQVKRLGVRAEGRQVPVCRGAAPRL